jgi:hypothetical protein
MKLTQRQQILDHLKRGDSITPLEALSLYGSLRLGAVIFVLKKEGYDIASKLVKRGRYNSMVAEYTLKAEV